MSSKEIGWLLQEKYHGEKTKGFFTDVARLEAGEPLAYIIGSITFLNTTITLDSKPLIPRVETEFWTAEVIKEIEAKYKDNNSEVKILDLCAGSGCIGIAIAKSISKAKIDFIEIDKNHLSTIKKNCRLNEINELRFRIFQGNIFVIEDIKALSKYDLIISNPPYIDSSLNRTDVSVQNFEPAIALYGGEKGLEIINQIILEAPKYLNKGGQLWLEHEPEQSTKIQVLSKTQFLCTTYNDQYQIQRFSKLVLQ